MKKTLSILLLLIIPVFAASQTLDERLKEIGDYANTVMTTWKAPGMAIAIVKDDKVVFQKGYGVKWIDSADSPFARDPNSSPEEAYKQLYAAVKNKDIAQIKGSLSKSTLGFAKSVAERQNVPIDFVVSNGFTATTFSASLPTIRDIRTKDSYGAVEVFNEKDERWEDLPFVFEESGWRLAIGEMFAGTFRSPGKSISQLEFERKYPKLQEGVITPRLARPVKTAKKGSARTDTVQSGFGTGNGSGSRDVVALSRRPDASRAVDENTVFAIASNSKAFTTAALAILVDEKKLNWDDKVSKYLPDFQMYDPWVTSELTVRDLVTHRVGLDTFSGDLLWYETTYSPDEILKRVRYLPNVSSFRSRYGYQNLMFIAAGKVVEKISGQTWCDFVTERILKPLDMNRTVCSIKTLPDNAAFPHNESGGKLRVLHRGNVDGAYSAAALNSSVADLSKWVRTQLGKGKFEGKQLFSEVRSWEMHQPYFSQQISENAWKANPTRHFSGVGMGWFVYDYQGRKIINHSGGLDGMLSYTVLIPEENVGFVILTNSESPGFRIIMNKIVDVFTNAPKTDWNARAIESDRRNKTVAAEEIKKVDAARVANTKMTLALKDYAGTYSDKMYGDVTIAEENGKLIMRFLPSPNFVADLEHWHYDTFVIKWRPSVAYNFPRGFVTFTIDKNGKTEELKIDQPNNDFWFYELRPKRAK